MQIKNKTATVVVIFLIISMGASMMLLPTTTAHTPAYQIKTYALVTALPTTVGVGQQVLVYAFLGNPPPPGAQIINTYRQHNYQIIVTAPDGKNTTTFYETVQDTTASQIYQFAPDQVGTYTVTFNYLGLTLRSGIDQPASTSSTSAINDTYLPSSATTTFTVQQEPIPNYPDSYPLPTEYWTRPIYGENPYWWTISSNWLGTGSPVNSAVSAGTITGIGTQSMIQRYPGDAVGSLTSHIMWTKPIQSGGVVGGNNFPIQGDTYFEGSAYSQRYTNPIIVNGRLYYNPPLNFLGSNAGPTTCVDLRTGEVIWQRSDVPAISFAYIYDLQDPNQHGVWPAFLCTSSFARVFDADTGEQLFNVTGVPSGTIVQGPQGEQLRYVLSSNLGNSTNPQYLLEEWNSTKLFSGTGFHPGQGGNSPSLVNASGSTISTPPSTTSTSVINASIFNSTDMQNRFDWNVSINSWRSTMSSAPTVLNALYNNIMICRNGSYPSLTGQTNADGSLVNANYTYFAVDINTTHSTFGQALWWRTIIVPNDRTITYGGLDPTVGVFVEGIKETRNFIGYSTKDGSTVFGLTPSQAPLDYFGNPIYPYVSSQLAYGKLYSYCYGGLLYCYDLTNGHLLWTYGNGGAGNSTDSGFQTPGNYPGFIQAVGNGVIYIVTTEHSVETPIYKGAFTRAINATDGTQIWTLSDYTGEFGAISYAIADGYTNFFNGYDNQIYTLGRGPSATTVSAPDVAASFGTPIVIKGSVTDISAGTKQNEQAARFPNGVPAVSDASMTDWMGYLYQQKPRPIAATGVKVTLSVLDSNNNSREIGTVTSDSDGFFSYQWTPEIPGKYTVTASFAGSEGYWPSRAVTAFSVLEAPAEPAAPEPAPPLPPYETYTIGTGIAIIAAVAIVGLMILRKKP
jgi:hypothetical protein